MSCTARELRSARLLERLVDVTWSDGSHSHFHPIWLRDNCRCDACGDPAIGYRSLKLTSLDLDLLPQELVAESSELAITWPDGHRSRYPAAWLAEHSYADSERRARRFVAEPWNDALRNNPPQFAHADLEGDDSALLRMLQAVRDHGICFLHSAPAEPGIVEALARRIGYPQESNFGRVQDLVFDPQKRSIANDIKALKPHTDEPYRASPPGLLLFHCIANDQTGAGSSIFVDGFEIAARLRAHDPEGFQALCGNLHAFRRYYSDDVDLIAEFPVISTDEFGQVCGLRINDRVAAPLAVSPSRVEVYYRGLQYLLKQSEDPQAMLHRTLQPGDIAVFDNHRVLHGRTDLTVDGKRWLQWVQIERGDFHSSLRILADRLGESRDTNPLMMGAYGNATNGVSRL